MLAKVLLSTAVVLAAIGGGRTNESWADCPRWTDWFDEDDPFTAAGDKGDYETLTALRAKHPEDICAKPTTLQAKTVPDANGDSIFAHETGDNRLATNVVNGFICRNADQPGDKKCRDYRVRFCCPEPAPECPRWTDWIDKDDPTFGVDIECPDEDVCDDPTAMEARVKDNGDGNPNAGKSASETGEIFKVFNCDVGLVCRGADQDDGTCEDYEIRFCCPEEDPDPDPDQPPVPTPEPPCSIDIVIVIDVSSSMPLSEFLRLLWFLIDFILCFDVDRVNVQIGVITYDCLPALDVPLGEFPSGDLRVLGAINGLERRGGRTRTGLALHYVKCMTDFREEGWSVVVLVTDGTEANGQGTDDYEAQAAMLRASGMELYAVAAGYPFLVNTAALGTITGSPDRVVDLTDPCGLANRIIEECCEEI